MLECFTPAWVNFLPIFALAGLRVLLLSKHNKLRIRAVRQQRLSPR